MEISTLQFEFNYIILIQTITLSIREGYFLGEGDEEGIIEFWGHEIDIEEAVRILRSQLVKVHHLLSGHHGAELLQKGLSVFHVSEAVDYWESGVHPNDGSHRIEFLARDNGGDAVVPASCEK